MSRNFNVMFSDLSFEKQEDILESLIDGLREDAETEGKEFLKRSWNDPKPKTWQEAYVRTYSISAIMWSDYEAQEPDATTPTDADWATYVEDHLREQAELAAHKAMKHLEVEIEI